MINKFLEKLGYTKADSLTEIQLLELYSKYVSDPVIEKEELERIYSSLKNVDGFVDLLNSLMANDISQHFQAQTEYARVTIKGAYGRLMQLKSRCLVDKASQERMTKISGVKYGNRTKN